jgi:hypothetical protein
MAEGVERLDYLKAHGASNYAFGWQDMPDAQHWKTARGGGATARLSEHAARLS